MEDTEVQELLSQLEYPTTAGNVMTLMLYILPKSQIFVLPVFGVLGTCILMIGTRSKLHNKDMLAVLTAMVKEIARDFEIPTMGRLDIDESAIHIVVGDEDTPSFVNKLVLNKPSFEPWSLNLFWPNVNGFKAPPGLTALFPYVKALLGLRLVNPDVTTTLRLPSRGLSPKHITLDKEIHRDFSQAEELLRIVGESLNGRNRPRSDTTEETASMPLEPFKSVIGRASVVNAEVIEAKSKKVLIDARRDFCVVLDGLQRIEETDSQSEDSDLVASKLAKEVKELLEKTPEIVMLPENLDSTLEISVQLKMCRSNEKARVIVLFSGLKLNVDRLVPAFPRPM